MSIRTAFRAFTTKESPVPTATPTTTAFEEAQARLKVRDEIYFEAQAAGHHPGLPNPEVSVNDLQIIGRLYARSPEQMLRAGVPFDVVAQHFPLPKPAPIITTPVAPVLPVVPVPAFAMPGSRPRVSNVVHLWDESNGTCTTAWVVEVLNGQPSAGVVVTETDPYLKVMALGARKPIYARYIAAPTKRGITSTTAIISSWHRVEDHAA